MFLLTHVVAADGFLNQHGAIRTLPKEVVAGDVTEERLVRLDTFYK